MPSVVSRQVQDVPVTVHEILYPGFAPLYRSRLSKAARVACFAVWSLVLSVFCNAAAAQSTCPNLSAYTSPVNDEDWPRIVEELVELQPFCLQSAEYYLLLGIAELNSGFVDPAVEALERALLLQPDSNAAAVEYAQALYLAGQIFPALELNEQLLQRDDLAADIAATLRQRQELWRGQTRRHTLSLESAVGYDNNLNGAPALSDFRLTRPGEILQLTLDEQFRPMSGPYVNFRLGGYYQRLGAYRTHELMYGIRTRQSETSDAELSQADFRYGMAIPLRRYRWDLTAGSTHMLYGGSPLFTATDLRARVRRLSERCQPLAEMSAQHQSYHQQRLMTGIEYGLTGGVECQFDERNAVVGIEAGAVRNEALRGGRPGADRDGWVLRLLWQQALAGGMVRTQYSLASLADDTGYSPLLENGALRTVYSRQFRVQYLRPLRQNLVFQFNFSHQRQGSNLDPFKNSGTAADVGLNLSF